jgi:putative nucleotidyltransferase with HDIG domain
MTGRDAHQSEIDRLARILGQLPVLRDPYTWEHSRRVEVMTIRLGVQVGFPAEKLILLGKAAFLHDIGKVAIPDAIVNKPTRLTEDEFRIIQQHTVLGHALIQPLGLDEIIGNAILYHHENFDGSGYPMGLSGEAIPWEARIIRLVDFHDALISPRPYRGAYSSAEAYRILRENRRCFDPALFRAFFAGLLL